MVVSVPRRRGAEVFGRTAGDQNSNMVHSTCFYDLKFIYNSFKCAIK